MPLLFDAHLDLSWNALSFDRDLTASIDEINARERGMTDSPARGNATVCLEEMRRGHIAVCVGTLLARSQPELEQLQRECGCEYRLAHGVASCVTCDVTFRTVVGRTAISSANST